MQEELTGLIGGLDIRNEGKRKVKDSFPEWVTNWTAIQLTDKIGEATDLQVDGCGMLKHQGFGFGFVKFWIFIWNLPWSCLIVSKKAD